MLRTLRIRNLAIIEDLAVEFGPGLNVLTGETGAGKSIVIDALGLAAGARAERTLVREGEQRLCVEALFQFLAHGAAAGWLAERGLLAPEATELLVRREVPQDGSGRAWIDGTPATQALLRELGAVLVSLHGQHAHRQRIEEPRQLALLDGFGGHEEAGDAVRRAAQALLGARERQAELRSRGAAREARAEELRRVVREVEGLAPRPGELEAIERERRLLQNASRVTALVDQALALCDRGEPSARGLAAAAAARAGELAGLDPALEPAAARLAAATVELQDLGRELSSYAERRSWDPGRLDEIETRRAELRRLCLRHATDEAGLLALATRAAAELAEIGALDESLAAAELERSRAAEQYAAAAGRLTALRRAAAPKLAAAVQAQLAALALGRARFEVALEPLDGHEGDARGAERATLLLAANAGEPLRPLSDVASGGELSRILLALHVVGGGPDGDGVQVFDEADAGVGGAVADAVGARLARLARRRQVLCVTHLPQIAAWADRHLRVSKAVAGGRTRTTVEALEGPRRVDELARMLDGRRRTPTSRRHASELLEAAGRG